MPELIGRAGPAEQVTPVRVVEERHQTPGEPPPQREPSNAEQVPGPGREKPHRNTDDGARPEGEGERVRSERPSSQPHRRTDARPVAQRQRDGGTPVSPQLRGQLPEPPTEPRADPARLVRRRHDEGQQPSGHRGQQCRTSSRVQGGRRTSGQRLPQAGEKPGQQPGHEPRAAARGDALAERRESAVQPPPRQLVPGPLLEETGQEHQPVARLLRAVLPAGRPRRCRKPTVDGGDEGVEEVVFDCATIREPLLVEQFGGLGARGRVDRACEGEHERGRQRLRERGVGMAGQEAEGPAPAAVTGKGSRRQEVSGVSEADRAEFDDGGGGQRSPGGGDGGFVFGGPAGDDDRSASGDGMIDGLEGQGVQGGGHLVQPVDDREHSLVLEKPREDVEPVNIVVLHPAEILGQPASDPGVQMFGLRVP